MEEIKNAKELSDGKLPFSDEEKDLIRKTQDKIKKSKAAIKLNNLIKVYEYSEERNDNDEFLKERMLEAGWVNTKLIDTIKYYDWIDIDNIRYVKVSFEKELCFNSFYFKNWCKEPQYYLKKSDLE